MIILTAEELKEKIEKHRKWLENAEGGEKLVGVYDLRGADLCGANLRSADLHDADLCGADLHDADLCGADLHNANLRGADLHNANFCGADLHDAKNIPYLPIACPTHGEFIAWKKVAGLIVKLKIPANAKRCSATRSKCRCDRAEVLAIENIDSTDSGLTEITNKKYAVCVYKVGEMVYPDSFDDNRWNECSHGIHFFVDRGEAERW